MNTRPAKRGTIWRRCTAGLQQFLDAPILPRRSVLRVRPRDRHHESAPRPETAALARYGIAESRSLLRRRHERVQRQMDRSFIAVLVGQQTGLGKVDHVTMVDATGELDAANVLIDRLVLAIGDPDEER